MRIDILAVDGLFDTGLSTLLDCFALAAGIAAGEDGEGPRFAVRRVGVRPEVHTGHGLPVPLDAVVDADAPAPDVVIVPALGCVTPAAVEAALARDEIAAAGAVLRAWGASGALVAGACTGTFVLAAAGVLDARPATTTWWLEPDFRRRFPQVELDTARMVVPGPGCLTAGAALAHVDLALWLIRQHSPQLAERTARYLLIDARPSQATFAMADHIAHTDEIVSRFERFARDHLRDFSMVDAAHALGTTPRTLQRRLHRALGRTPIAYVQDLRVEAALHLLQTTEQTLFEVAEAVGYADPVTLRTLVRRKTGRGIRAIRQGR